jgi:hypothetical protein
MLLRVGAGLPPILASSLVLGLALVVPMAAAQQLAPPDLGAVVMEDSLVEPGVVSPYRCRSGRGSVEFVGEGLISKVTGTCSESSMYPVHGPTIRGLTFADGEIQVEIKAVSGLERAQFAIAFRISRRTEPPEAYSAWVAPALGRAAIFKGPPPGLAQRDGLAGVLSPNDWNRVAVRAQGPNLWLLVNDQVALSVADATFDRGEAALWAGRAGDPGDAEESAVVMRNLRVSALAGGDPARAPTYQRP